MFKYINKYQKVLEFYLSLKDEVCLGLFDVKNCIHSQTKVCDFLYQQF